MKVSVLIPFFNEAPILQDTVGRLDDAMRQLPYDYELLFCDDGSNDGGAELLNRLENPRLRVIGGAHCGKGGALCRGVLEATGDILFYTDADLAYGTEVIGVFLDTVAKNGGIAVGNRTQCRDGFGTYSPFRKLASACYRLALGGIVKLPAGDPQSGCKAYLREAALAVFIPLREKGFSFEFETLLRAEKLGIPVTQVPVRVLSNGKSHVHPWRDGISMLYKARKIARRVRKENSDGG